MNYSALRHVNFLNYEVHFGFISIPARKVVGFMLQFVRGNKLQFEITLEDIVKVKSRVTSREQGNFSQIPTTFEVYFVENSSCLQIVATVERKSTPKHSRKSVTITLPL